MGTAVHSTAQGLVALFCVACMRLTSTPDVWPCRDTSDCEAGEICFSALSAAGSVGQCRPADDLGSSGSPFIGHGAPASAGSGAFAPYGGSPSVGIPPGDVDLGIAGWISQGGNSGEVPIDIGGSSGGLVLAGAGGSYVASPCGGGPLPRVDNVAPAVVSNRANTIIVRGAGFTAVAGPLTLNFGGMLSSVIPDSDTQITFETPTSVSGPAYYSVSVSSNDCPGTSNARVFVMDPTPLSAQSLSAPSTRERLIFDAERHTLYGSNRTDQQLERYHESAGRWEVQKPVAIPELTDVAMAPGGHSLLVSSKTAIFEIDLDAEPLVAKQRAVSPNLFCGNYFHQLAVANDGNALIVARMSQCSGFNASFRYSTRDRSIVASDPSTYDGSLAASYDGSRIFFNLGLSSPSFYSALTSSVSNASNVPAGGGDMSVSGNASRVIIGTDVRSGSLSLTGKLPMGGVVLASVDSTRAFVFREDDSGAHLVIHDLNGELVSGAAYPVQKTIDLSQRPSELPDQPWTISMTSPPDDSTVFISGNQRILIVPIKQ